MFIKINTDGYGNPTLTIPVNGLGGKNMNWKVGDVIQVEKPNDESDYLIIHLKDLPKGEI